MARTIFYKPQEVADLLRVTTETIYDYIRSGKLRAVQLGNRYRIEKTDLDAFIVAAAVAPAVARTGSEDPE